MWHIVPILPAQFCENPTGIIVYEAGQALCYKNVQNGCKSDKNHPTGMELEYAQLCIEILQMLAAKFGENPTRGFGDEVNCKVDR